VQERVRKTWFFLKDLVEAGTIKPVIDRCYPLEQISEAHRYGGSGHKKRNVVIPKGRMNRNDEKMEKNEN
jgi:NADPH:quinone reductase-like Zn-dependent oxidoreductase